MKTAILYPLVWALSLAFATQVLANNSHTKDLIDSDTDGVINERDQCANTPKNTNVDNNGCTPWISASTPKMVTIDFDYDQAVIKKSQTFAILSLVKLMLQYPAATVALIGDTSAEGGQAHNQELAQARAKALETELLRLGVAQERMTKRIYTEQSASIDLALQQQRQRRTQAILYINEKRPADPAWSLYGE